MTASSGQECLSSVRRLALPGDVGHAVIVREDSIHQGWCWSGKVLLLHSDDTPKSGLIVWILGHQQCRPRRPDDADGATAPIERRHVWILVQVPYYEDRRTSLFC